MRRASLLLLASLPLLAGERTTPATVANVMPRGIAIGKTSELKVEGLNLTGATKAYFDKAGITASVKSIRQLPDLPDIRFGSAGLVSTIDLGPLPPRMEVTFEVKVDEKAEPGPVSFRVQTPLGTSPEGRFILERPDPVIAKPGTFQPPAILAGAIAKTGDTAMYKLTVQAGEELSFENPAMRAGSSLQPVISLLRENGTTEAEYGHKGGPEVNAFRHKFETAGTYTVKVSDYLQSGRANHFYRIRVSKDSLTQPAMMMTADEEMAPGNLVSRKGVIDAPGREHSYKFTATKGQPVVIEVNARRSGSDLDSVIDVFDAAGKPVEIATARAVLETTQTLNDRDSTQRGIRLTSATGLNAGDYLLIGTEIVRLDELPEGPDADTVLEAFGGERRSFFGTSGEAHYNDSAVYKLQIHPAGSQFSPNGLPLVRLYARNDDGGPVYGRDSYLMFTIPKDGEYTVRVRDTRGMGGPKFSYTLSVRTPKPDFRVSFVPRNPNVPAGGTIPLTVTAFRMDGFDGPIDVNVADLPAGLTATKGQIAPGQDSTTILLSAKADAALETAQPFQITAKAGNITHAANSRDKLKLVSVTKKPDVVVTAETREVEIEPGGTAEISVSIRRNNNFAGRVPIEIRNLPPRVHVPDIGLNGVLITENETQRSFRIEALDIAEPVDQWIYLSARVETRSENPSYAAPQAIHLRVRPRAKQQQASAQGSSGPETRKTGSRR